MKDFEGEKKWEMVASGAVFALLAAIVLVVAFYVGV